MQQQMPQQPHQPGQYPGWGPQAQPVAQAPGYGFGPPVGEVPLAPVAKKPSRVLTRIAPVLVGVGLLGGGGYYAAGALSGGDGADSATAAVEAFFAAVENEDVIGVMESMTPAERDLMVQPAQDVSVELKRLGILSEEMSLDGVQGIDIEIDGLQLEPEELADGVMAVHVIGGEATLTVDTARLPMGERLRDLQEEFGGAIEDEVTTETGDLSEIGQLVAVKRNGGWGVSLGYSVAEWARRDAGEPLPVFADAPLRPIGANSPEAAVSDLADAIDRGDLEGVLGMLDPGELGPMYDYSELFLDEGVREFREAGDLFEIDEFVTEASGSGDRRSVAISRAVVSIRDEYSSGTMEWDGSCLTVHEDGQQVMNSCDMGDDEMSASFRDLAAGSALSVHEVDGRWYVSPTATFTQSMLAVLRAIDDDAIAQFEEAMIGPAGLLGSMFGGYSDFDDLDDFEAVEPPRSCGAVDTDPECQAEQLWNDTYDCAFDDDGCSESEVAALCARADALTGVEDVWAPTCDDVRSITEDFDAGADGGVGAADFDTSGWTDADWDRYDKAWEEAWQTYDDCAAGSDPASCTFPEVGSDGFPVVAVQR
ncbi:MAG: hypothetical protein OEY23_02770 [Acidimicrobiia bacterium]|nr:hypothetical protein [Acidimicrobiia bacterium]